LKKIPGHPLMHEMSEASHQMQSKENISTIL